MNNVDIIIPTLNARNLLCQCLHHLAASTYSDFRVIVYDDGSHEDVASVVAAECPGAMIIRSEVNRGLAYGFNAAIDAGDAPYVVVLNNDVEVNSTWLAELVACAQRNPHAGSIASKIRLFNDRSTLHSAGDWYSHRGVAGNRGVWLEDTGQYDNESEVFAACGAAALYRRSALDAVRLRNGNVFDERLFMYYEDVDLAWRLQRAGYPCVFAYRAVVYHMLSATAGGPLASFLVARNTLLVLSRSVPPNIRTPNRPRIAARLAGSIVTTVPHLCESAARATMRGFFAGILGMCRGRTEADPLMGTNHERIEALLAHAWSERFGGVPVARLRLAPVERGRMTRVASPAGRRNLV